MNLYRNIRKRLSPLKGKCIEKKYERLFKRKGSRKLDQNEKIYYIIRRYPREAGFFSNYLYVLSHMAYARQEGYTPVVDMKNYPTYYNEKTAVHGTKNAWEYYFHQVDGTSLEEAYKSRNYILSDTGFQKQGMRLLDNIYFFPLEDSVEFYHELCREIKFEDTLEKELQSAVRELHLDKRKTLGVHVRGTDMRCGKFGDHPQTLNFRTYIEMVKKFLLEDGEIEQIYLATDEEEIGIEFRRQFEEMVYTSDVYRAKGETDMGIHYSIDKTRNNHHFLLGKEVVRDAFLLSQCNKLICGLSNVASTAIIWNHNQYEKIGVLCKADYKEKIIDEMKKRKNIEETRYIIGCEVED